MQEPSHFVGGLTLNRLFYDEVIRPILDAHYPNLRHSAARIGPGSDVLGYDDAMSTDHDWGLRLTLFLAPDDALALQQPLHNLFASQLPYTFRGYSTHFSAPNVDDNGTQVLEIKSEGPVNHRISCDTLRAFVATQLNFDIEQAPTSVDWLSFTQQRLLELTAGALYHDDLGLASLRARFAYFPHDVWLYLLASGWVRISQEEHLMGRAGYRGDEIGSALIGSRLVRDVMSLCFLMERRYAPYPKWFGTAFAQLACAEQMTPLLTGALAATNWHDREAQLVAAYELLVAMHNRLGITQPLDTTSTSFFGRPFRVITFNGIIPAITAQIKDAALHPLLERPLIGSPDQFSDSTDIRSYPLWRPILKQLYE